MTSEVMDPPTVPELGCYMTHTRSQDTSTSNQAPALASDKAMPQDCERKLRRVLRANATTSAITGLAMLLAPSAIDDVLETGHPSWVRVVGIGLLPFAAVVAWLSSSTVGHLRRFTAAIVAGDVGWVAASLITVVLGWYSGRGVVVVLAVAVFVGGYALLQSTAVRHLSPE